MDDDEDADTAVVAAFLAGAGPLAGADQDAPTGVILGAAPESSHRSPTSASLASSIGPDDEDLLSSLL